VLAGALFICECTLAHAEPLFFKCHGTFQRPDGQDHRDKPDETLQIMIDPDRGVPKSSTTAAVMMAPMTTMASASVMRTPYYARARC
jgi:hypothetical protein